MTGPVEGLLWGSLGLAAYSLLVHPVVVIAWAAVRRRSNRTDSPSRTPLVKLVSIGRLRDSHLVERIEMLIRAAELHGRCECLVAVPRDELGYVRERVGKRPGACLLPTESPGFDAALLDRIARESTCDAVLVVPPGIALDEDAIVRMSSALQDGVGLVQGLVERAENSPWLSARMAVAETAVGGLHRIGDGPFLVRAERLIEACGDPDGINAATLATALAAAGQRVEAAPSVAVPTTRSSASFLEFEDDAARYFGWARRTRDRAAFAGGIVGFWLRLHERLRDWTPALFVIALAANIALAAEPFYLNVLAAQEVAHLVWLLTRRSGSTSRTEVAPEVRAVPAREEPRCTSASELRRSAGETMRTDGGTRTPIPATVRDPRRGTRSTTVLGAHR